MDYEMMKSGAVPVTHQYVNIKRHGKYQRLVQHERLALKKGFLAVLTCACVKG